MSDTYFYIFATLTVASALGVVFNRNAVAAALSFLFSLCGVAGLFLQLDAQLLAILLVLVYAGAVVALFLFIIMLLDMQGGERKPFKKLTVFASTIAGALLLLGVYGLAKRPELAVLPPAGQPSGILLDLKYYGAQLFTTYLLPVQVVGFLLLIAMLGVIGLASMETVTRDRQVAGFQNRARVALYAAEGGVAQAVGIIRRDAQGLASGGEAALKSFNPAFPGKDLDALIAGAACEAPHRRAHCHCLLLAAD